jgi:hypothetical protein
MTTPPDIDWKVGGTVYVAASRQDGDSKNFPIKKVGRTWAYIDRGGDFGLYRVEKATGRVEAAPGHHYGHAWPSRAAFEAETARQRAWRGFKDLLSGVYYAPGGVSRDDINKAAQLLGLKGDGITL